MKTIEELKREAEELERRVAEKRAADEEANNPERLALEKRIADAKRELGIDDHRGLIEELMRRAERPHPYLAPQPYTIPPYTSPIWWQTPPQPAPPFEITCTPCWSATSTNIPA